MKQFPRPAQASRKYFYFFIGFVSLVVLMDLAGGVRSVDSQRSAAEAKEKKLLEDYKALFYDDPTTSLPTATTKASDSQAQQSKINPISPLMTFSNATTEATAANAPNPTKASPDYPSQITVPGSFTGTVASISVVLHNVNSNGGSFSSVAFTGFVLVAPSGKSMEIMGGVGDGTDGGGLSNVTITFQDGNGAVAPPNNVAISPNTGSKNWKPSSNGSSSSPEPHNYLAPAGTPQFFAATHGSATMNSVFVGEAAAGTWKIYLEDFFGDPVSFSSWDLVLTASAAAGTTTTVTSSLNPSFTSGANSSVTLTATVSSGTNG